MLSSKQSVVVNPVSSSEALPPKASRIVSTILSPAIQLWLRSQVEQVEALEVKIEGSDRLLLTGHVPKVSLSASHAVYQGLHLSEIHLVALDIRINLGQMLRGKPLRLLEPVPVTGELLLQEADLNDSLKAPLLANALTEFLATWLGSTDLMPSAEAIANATIDWQQATLDRERLVLSGICVDPNGNKTPLELRTGLQVEKGHHLRLVAPQIQGLLGLGWADLEGFEIDLGSEVDIQELTLNSGQMVFRGRLLVRSEA